MVRAILAFEALCSLAACAHAPLPLVAPHAASGAAAAATTDTYYKAVASLQGPALMKGLHALTGSGQKVYGYNEARDKMFALVDDVANKDVVVDVYCGRTSKGVTDRVSAFQRGLNAEHTWPQSMGAMEEPAKSDLHHIFPADAGTNSMRNNHPFGVPAKVSETLPDYQGSGQNSRIGTASDGVVTFEPRDDHKGDAARAMMYFYMRYGYRAPAKAGVKLDNFKREFATLWRWHFQDPPSEKERARNEAIFRLQRNRNPFIDHPEYVQRIGHFLAARNTGVGAEGEGDDGDIIANNGAREDEPGLRLGL